MVPHGLTLFRRHERKCKCGYPKELRLFEYDSTKATGKRQCTCPVSAEGTIRLTGQFLKSKATGVREFADAHQVAAMWQEWGGTEPPAKVVQADAQQLEEAIERFLTKKRGENISDVTQHVQLLQLRLMPFAQRRGLKWIYQLDSKSVIEDFRNSWRNENPLKNRKLKAGQKLPVLSLKPSTAKRMLSDFRQFCKYCVGHKWMSENWASRDHIVIRSKVDPKDPFTPEEEQAIFEATTFISDGRGFRVKRTGQHNATELLAFLKVARHTGMRLGDVVSLRKSELVRFEGRIAVQKVAEKNGKLVTVPLVQEVVDLLDALPLKRGDYFFLGGETEILETSKTHWQKRYNRCLQIAHGLHRFTTPSPTFHTWRHTFAARLLEGGMEVRDVAEFLGDTVPVVLRHYSKFTKGQLKMAVAKWEAIMSARPKHKSA
jgi:integrase